MSFNIYLLFLTILLSFICCIQSTDVEQCKDEPSSSFDSIISVHISNCSEPPCQLVKSTTVNIEQRFILKKNVHNLVTSVYATINGLPFPFIGVNGRSACDEISDVYGAPAGCHLKANTPYTYKNSFPIYLIYPQVSLTVYWALKEDDDVVTCFEVPASITSS